VDAEFEADQSTVMTILPSLLDALPVTCPDLARVSDERARELFDAFRLEITYDKPTHTIRCRATLPADTLPTAVAAAADDHAAIGVVPPTGFEPVLPVKRSHSAVPDVLSLSLAWLRLLDWP
jgi:hypothetical protein